MQLIILFRNYFNSIAIVKLLYRLLIVSDNNILIILFNKEFNFVEIKFNLL